MRFAVMATAAAAAGLGLVVIFSLPIGAFVRAAAGLAWFIISSAEMLFISSAYKRFGRILIGADGSVRLRDRSGQWQDATIQSGSVVLSKLAWLRLKPVTGCGYRELVCGDSRESKQWRRLQVIWRHLGTAS